MDGYQLRGYLVSPMTIVKIRGIANHARSVLKLPNTRFDMEIFLEGLVNFGITVDVIDDLDMPGSVLHSEAWCIPETATIYLTENTYKKACENDPRTLFTVFHELGHLVLGHRRELHRGQITHPVKPYRDSEWQADQFAAEIIMPLEIIICEGITTALEIQQRFGVSAPAAQRRIDQLLSHHEIQIENR